MLNKSGVVSANDATDEVGVLASQENRIIVVRYVKMVTNGELSLALSQLLISISTCLSRESWRRSNHVSSEQNEEVSPLIHLLDKAWVFHPRANFAFRPTGLVAECSPFRTTERWQSFSRSFVTGLFVFVTVFAAFNEPGESTLLIGCIYKAGPLILFPAKLHNVACISVKLHKLIRFLSIFVRWRFACGSPLTRGRLRK